ncbi:MAG: beta-propeller domain-containing protein [Ornithinimicrobium sp.]|uniref:beta-propeller domain-containing protein n=1 Tax=Ornithinimicrobium sp. TaxID=1977084 RepID=UPI0026DEB887|nr:beta-propeller domain-containing protein [Ornithinimicrobium sp.]MDO5739948.1 beta-propeller domain-containing protein [Ornithinimicrobium sp.]
MPRSHVSTFLAIPLAASLLLAGCSVSRPADPRGDAPQTGGQWDESVARAAITALPANYLAGFGDCSELLTYYQANALEMVTPYGIGGWGGSGGFAESAPDDSSNEGGAAPAAGTASDGQASYEAGKDYSGTNVQEEGVDEPDIVKTNGSIIIAVTNGRVRIVDVQTRKVISTVTLPGRRDQAQPSEILLHGQTLVVLSQEWNYAQPVDGTTMAFNPGRTIVTTVDISDPASPTTIGSTRMEGSYRSARLVGDTVRMVMVTEPPGVLTTAPKTGTLTAEAEAEQANRELVRSTTIDDWIPHLQQLDADGRALSTDPLLDCDQISRPRDPAGLSTLSVLTFDVGSANPAPTSGAGLVASGGTVYASTDRLVVATSGWDLWNWMPMASDAGVDSIWPGGAPANRTDLHSFDISEPNTTRYVASGSVDGRLINQWALDEDAGVIRAATTTDPPGASGQSQSSLVVLREEGDQLSQTGRVDGLGLDEQIQSVRYLSKDVAAVVTFRQTDPLYLIDTSDPTAPKVAGELKIPGFSAYLHPIADGWLLGVGQDADVETGQSKGLQVSLFDIRDLSSPKQTQVVTWGSNSYSPIENDHRAFLSWPATGQVVIPYTRWSESTDGKEAQDSFAGVTTLTVGTGTLVKGKSTSTSAKNKEWGEAPLRTMVIGDDLWTLDWAGLARFDLASLEGGWAVDLP